MPRPRSDNPSPATIVKRRQRDRRREGVVHVQIGPDSYEVSEAGAKRLRRQAEKLGRGDRDNPNPSTANGRPG